MDRLIMKRLFDEVTDNIREKDIDTMQQKMEGRLMRWESINIKLAVLGNLGVGKSSFINAFKK